MEHTTLIAKMDAASVIAGEADDGWNRRYISALNIGGLYLSWWPEDSVPEGVIMAPKLCPTGWQYQYPSYVTTE